jgi:hypothetical protein
VRRRARWSAEQSVAARWEENALGVRPGTTMTETVEQQLATLLRVLRPAPAAWVTLACEIPRLERDMEHPPELAGPTGVSAEEEALRAAALSEHETGPAADA